MARKTPEGRFAEEFCGDLERLFPGCVILKNDEQLLQGVPDRLLLWGPHWAMLEFKAHEKASVRPNQQYYIELFGEMSFAAFVYPENKEEVLDAIQHAFGARRSARISKRK